MGTLMKTLVVLRPRGQRDDVFHDSRLENVPHNYSSHPVTLYSYEILPGNVLKIYSHETSFNRSYGTWGTSASGREVAHFRPNQWDSVRER